MFRSAFEIFPIVFGMTTKLIVFNVLMVLSFSLTVANRFVDRNHYGALAPFATLLLWWTPMATAMILTVSPPSRRSALNANPVTTLTTRVRCA